MGRDCGVPASVVYELDHQDVLTRHVLCLWHVLELTGHPEAAARSLRKRRGPGQVYGPGPALTSTGGATGRSPAEPASSNGTPRLADASDKSRPPSPPRKTLSSESTRAHERDSLATAFGRGSGSSTTEVRCNPARADQRALFGQESSNEP